MKYQTAPLSGGFMILGIFTFLIGIFFIYDLSASWGIIVTAAGLIVFLASMISVTNAPVEEELAIDAFERGESGKVRVLSRKEYLEEEKLALLAKKESSPKKSLSKTKVVSKKKPVKKKLVRKKISSKKSVSKKTLKKTTTKKVVSKKKPVKKKSVKKNVAKKSVAKKPLKKKVISKKNSSKKSLVKKNSSKKRSLNKKSTARTTRGTKKAKRRPLKKK